MSRLFLRRSRCPKSQRYQRYYRGGEKRERREAPKAWGRAIELKNHATPLQQRPLPVRSRKEPSPPSEDDSSATVRRFCFLTQSLASTECMQTQPHLPLPAGLGRGRQATSGSVASALTIGGFAKAARSAHPVAGVDCLFDPGGCIGLDIEIGMRRGFDHQCFLLTAWIDANGEGLDVSGGRFLIQADAEDPSLPEGGSFAALDPPPGSCGRGGHERLLVLINNWDKQDG